MSLHYQIGELLFFPHKNEIHCGKKVFQVRPKTAELLTVLVKANGKVVSKTELLALVWNDVIVEEHVIFQSITELRKIFDDKPVIKTHPRKGYSITVPIVEHETLSLPQTAPSYATKSGDKEHNDVSTRKLKRPKKRFLLASFAFATLIISVLLYVKLFPAKTLSTGTGAIIVLPVNNKVENNTHQWLTYGGMDVLIKQLQSNVETQVMPAEIVLETLNRAEVNTQSVDESAIRRLFQVSGAQMIITQTVSGFSGDLHLVYSIYERNNVNHGALFADSTDDLFQSLSTKILEALEVLKPLEPRTYQHSFTDALLAAAVEELRLGKHEESITLFKALLAKEPDNLLAVKLLAKSLVFEGRYQEAESIAASAVDIAMKQGDNRNLGRLFFWQALSLTQQGKYDEALSILHYAKAKNQHTNDLLYLANSSRVTGKVYLQQEKYELAWTEIDRALTLYQSIKEPYGQISMYIDLGELELKLANTDAANSAFSKALKLAENRDLKSLISTASDLLKQNK